MAAARRVDDEGAQAILAALGRHDVRFVLIGGRAAQAHGWRQPTDDLDITPARTRENLTRLAAALTELDARFDVDPIRYPDGFWPPGGLDARSFEGQVWLNLLTRHGRVDIALVPDGTRGYDDLARRAALERVPGTSATVMVAASEDILRSKQASDRPKDRAQLESMQLDIAARRRQRERDGPALDR